MSKLAIKFNEVSFVIGTVDTHRHEIDLNWIFLKKLMKYCSETAPEKVREMGVSAEAETRTNVDGLGGGEESEDLRRERKEAEIE